MRCGHGLNWQPNLLLYCVVAVCSSECRLPPLGCGLAHELSCLCSGLSRLVVLVGCRAQDAGTASGRVSVSGGVVRRATRTIVIGLSAPQPVVHSSHQHHQTHVWDAATTPSTACARRTAPPTLEHCPTETATALHKSRPRRGSSSQRVFLADGVQPVFYLCAMIYRHLHLTNVDH